MPDSVNRHGNVPMGRVVDFAKHRDVMRYDPALIDDVPQFRNAVRGVLGDLRGAFKPSAERRFVTLGSCFAQNISEALKVHGANVYTNCITEDVNSPHNNRILLERVFELKNTPFTDELMRVTHLNYIELLNKFKEATDIVFTLGNIFHIEDSLGHTLLSKNGTILVREEYEETLFNLRRILALLNTHTKARLYVSVSPVPISGYRGIHYKTAVEADCASKCQLMTALRNTAGYIYVPTFEIFRWLAAHQAFPSLGGDGNPRHLNKEHVAAVMGVLCFG